MNYLGTILYHKQQNKWLAHYLFCCWWYKHECRYFLVQRVHIFVPGQKEIPKESLLLSKKFEFSSLTSIISCNWFKIMMSHSFFKRHFLLHIIRFKGAQNYKKWNNDHTFHYVVQIFGLFAGRTVYLSHISTRGVSELRIRIRIRGYPHEFWHPHPHPHPQYFMRMSCGYRK